MIGRADGWGARADVVIEQMTREPPWNLGGHSCFVNGCGGRTPAGGRYCPECDAVMEAADTAMLLGKPEAAKEIWRAYAKGSPRDQDDTHAEFLYLTLLKRRGAKAKPGR